jgi:hypothetical protein
MVPTQFLQPLPEALSRETLEIYGEIARRLIEENNDPSGVQAIRFRLVLKALKLLAG